MEVCTMIKRPDNSYQHVNPNFLDFMMNDIVERLVWLQCDWSLLVGMYWKTDTGFVRL